MSHVFARGSGLPTVARAEGCQLWDTEGRRYLDGAGGAIVVGIGHGDASVATAIAEQLGRVAYAHGTMFASEQLEAYADELAPLLPVDDPRIYPVSGGSEAVETALKMARAYHLARGEDRWRVIGRQGSYHGNTRGALDVGGREPLRRPYLPWLGLAGHTLAPYEYRCRFGDTHPAGCGARYADALEQEILASPAGTVAAFVAEPVAGAGLGAAVPPDDYWPAVTEVCRRHGVLVIADEVMTGFGRTGRWFACDHWAVRPDILVLAKGAASGYWPLGLAVASGAAVLRVLRDRHLVEAAETQGKRLRAGLEDRLGDHRSTGDIRGLGLMVAVELVADRATRAPFPRRRRVAERAVAAARDLGLLLYSSTGCADGSEGDLVMLGPPLVITDPEVDELVELTAQSVEAATRA